MTLNINTYFTATRHPRGRGDPEARSEKDWIPGLPPGMTQTG